MNLLTTNVLGLVCTGASLVMTAEAQIAPTATDAYSIVSSFLTAIQESNGAKAVPLLDSLVQWNQPGNNQLSGIKRNKTEVLGLFKSFHELSAGTLRLTDIKVLAVNDNSVACLLHFTAAQPTGKILDVDNIDIYRVTEGKIKDVVTFSADLKREDEFWGHK